MDDQISSTTPSHDVHHDDEGEFRAEKQANSLMDEDFSSREAQARVPEVEGILDLAGGAKDALERHRSTMPRTEEPLLDFGEPEPSSTFKPEPEAPKPEPEAPKPETEAPKLETEAPKPEPISSSGDASPKQAKPKEKATKRLSLADLLYWRDLQRTGVVFGTGVVLLLSLKQCSIISVISYVALALLSVTISFRIYKGILQAVQKSEDGHPFKMYLDKDTAIPTEMVHKYSDSALVHINHVIKELRRIFLVEDLVDSLKFAVLMWVLTYIGAWFNGLTLILSGFIGAFCCPVIYEKNQAQLDPYIRYLDKQFKETVAKIMALIPGVKPKTE